MKTSILENYGVLEEKGATDNGIFTVDPEHPVYQDPFYADDNTVLALFPFDLPSYDENITNCWIVLAIFSVGFLLTYFLVKDGFVNVTIFTVLLLLSNLRKMWIIQSTWNQRRCAHIAIATTSIYLDEVTAPGSRTLKNRQNFKYKDYQHCYVAPSGYNDVELEVKLKKKSSIQPPFVLVKGLLGAQVFADKVNAMIEQVAVKTPGNNTSEIGEFQAVMETIEQGPRNECDMMLGNDNVAMAVVTEAVSLKVEDLECPFSYHDPFYENDDTVLSAFLLDQQNYVKPLVMFWTAITILMTMILAVIFFPYYLSDITSYKLMLLTMLLWQVRTSILTIQAVQKLRQSSHIAVAKTGIYKDVVNAPRSRIHMSRTLLKYEDYHFCYAEKSNYFAADLFDYMGYKIMLQKKNRSDPPIVLAWGLLETQLFVDKVNAMIEQVAEHKRSLLPIAPLL
jgi:hypothetical protein